MSMFCAAFVIVFLLFCGEATRLFSAFPKVREPKSDAGFIEKRAVCTEEGGDQIAGCPYFAARGYCEESSPYFTYVTSNCEASCELCEMPPTPPPAVDPTACLTAHNQKRHLHGARPLVWDDTLAQDAKNWADHLASTGSFDHDPSISEGENIFRGSSSEGAFSCVDAVESWYKEIDHYDFDNPPETEAEFKSGPDIGHFTQVVWNGTISVGAALTAITGNNGFTTTYLVARYSPTGNVLGQFSENVYPLV